MIRFIIVGILSVIALATMVSGAHPSFPVVALVIAMVSVLSKRISMEKKNRIF